MMKINPIATLLGASAIAFMLPSCESPQEEVREDKVLEKADRIEERAEEVRINAEETADKLENKADVIRDRAEERADELEDKADIVREAE